MKPSHSMFKHMLILFSFLLTALSENITFCYLSKQCYEINDITFAQKWKTSLKQKLDNVTEIRVHSMKLNEQNYVTLFSHKLPSIKKIIFWSRDIKSPRKFYLIHNTLTPKIVQTIFTSSYFSQLEELDLAYTNLDYRHFLFLDRINSKINSNLKIFILIGNFLEKKAFNLLQKINFDGKLDSLALSQNSLISPESIHSILKMIKSFDGPKSNLRNLTVYNTQITTDNMILLLENIEVSNMTNLNLAQNPFQHSKSFKIPFNNTFYSFLSKCNFSSLQRLCLTRLDLDEEQLPYLKNLKLESLETLELSQNFVTDAYFGDWISKNNMPNLVRLHLQSNSLSDMAMKFLAQQKFPKLAQLYLVRNRKLTPKHLHYLAQIDSSKWTHLDFSFNSVFQVSLREFFQNKSFDNLISLQILFSSDSFRFFDFLPWKSMKKLQFLELSQTDFSWSVQTIVDQNISFPSLKKWSFGGNWMTKQHLKILINNLKHFGPRLEFVEVLNSRVNQQTGHINLSEISFDNIPKGTYITNLGYMTVYRPEIGEKFEILQLIFGDQSSSFFQTMFHYSFFGKYQQANSNYVNKVLVDPKQLNLAYEHLNKIISFEKLEGCMFWKNIEFNFFKRVFFNQDPKVCSGEYKNYVESNIDYKPSFQMAYLNRINYIKSLQFQQQCPFLFYLTKMQIPLLRQLFIGDQRHKHWIKLAKKALKQHNNIGAIFFTDNKLKCQNLTKLLENENFPFLIRLSLTNNQIEHECLQEMIARHNLVRDLALSDNFLQTQVFDEILVKSDLILTNLQIAQIQIASEQFGKIQGVNRQFLQKLKASSLGIDSDAIFYLIGNNTSPWLFPRCIEMLLNNNNINQTGITALLETGMPYLKHIQFGYSNNPNLMNNLLSYPNHLDIISLRDESVYGLSKQLDHRSTRHVTNLIIQSSSLILEDYEVLSKMNFNNLKMALLTFQNIYECQILNYILQIVQNVQGFGLTIINDKIKGKTFNDTCILRHNSTQIYMRHMYVFNVDWQGVYVYIPNFYSYLYSKNQIVSALALGNCLIGDQALLNILENCNLEHLWAVVLVNNLLTQKSIAKLFELQLGIVKQIELGNNLIGPEGLKTIAGKSLNGLSMLGLAQNQIDHKGIQYLTQASFKILQVLILDGNDITKQAFVDIFKMNAPKLKVLTMRNNLMDEEDLVWALERISIQKFPFLTFVQTNIKVGWKNGQRLEKIRNEKFKRADFQVIYESFYLQSINKAVI